MSRWIRGIYNAAANFNMSRSLRAAAGRILDRDTEHVRKECDKSNKCEQPCESSESNCAATSRSAIATTSARTSASGSSASSNNKSSRGDSCHPSGKHSDDCTCILCVDYRDYTASIRTEGQGAGSWIRLSDESGTFKQSNPDAAGSVERVTGVPTGVTI